MSKTTRRAVAFAALACACLAAGCSDAPTEEKKGATPSEAKVPQPGVADLPADMVAAVSAGKVANAIGVHFALRAPPTVNTALPVDVAIVPHRKFALVHARFESHDGLATTVGEEFGPANDVDGEKALTHQLVLLPTKEGMFMVTASVETESDEGNVTRIFSIPVIVSARPSAPGRPAPAPAPAAADPPPTEPAKN
jgi:hypothetical protein